MWFPKLIGNLHKHVKYFLYIWPIPGKVKLLLISGKKSASLLDHISRFLSHQFVTWYLRSISKTKIVKLFCPCMSEHMIYIKNVTNVTQTLHQNVTNVTKQNIASKEILTIEFHTKYMKLFVNMLSVICILLNTKFHNTSENFYFEVILSRTIVSCKVTNVTNRYMDFILDLDEELIFKDLYVLTRTGCTIINQKFVDSMFVPGAVAIQKWNFPLFFGHKRDAGMGHMWPNPGPNPTKPKQVTRHVFE